MSQSSPSQNKILIEINNYVQNIEIAVALSSIFERFDGIPFIGNKLFVAPKQSEYVRPDVRGEFNGDMEGYAVLCESKVSLPNPDKISWDEDIDQLKSYDNDFVGWKTKIKDHEIVCITATTLTLPLWEKIEQLAKSQPNKYQFRRKLFVVQYSRQDKALHDVMTLKKLYGGEMAHRKLSRQLDIGQDIIIQNEIRAINAIRFNDTKPPLIYLMEVLWDGVFPNLIPSEVFASNPAGKTIDWEVKVDEILSYVRSRYTPPSNPDVIKRDWIKEAMRQFAEISLADQIDDNGDRYTIHFKDRIGRKKQTRNFIINLTSGKTKIKRRGEKKDFEQSTLTGFFADAPTAASSSNEEDDS